MPDALYHRRSPLHPHRSARRARRRACGRRRAHLVRHRAPRCAGRRAEDHAAPVPSNAVALNGAVTRQARAWSCAARPRAADPGSWSFRWPRADPARDGQCRAPLRTARVPVRLGVARLHVRTRMSPHRARGGGSDRRRLSSAADPPGAAPARVRGDRHGNVRLAAAVPTAHGWRFMLENTGAAGARAGVSARCLRHARDHEPRSDGSSSAWQARPRSSNTFGPGAERSFYAQLRAAVSALRRASRWTRPTRSSSARSSPWDGGADTGTFADAARATRYRASGLPEPGSPLPLTGTARRGH